MQNKKIYLEILRILSCFLVVASHTNGFVLNELKTYDFTYFITTIYHIFSRIAVPIFFMISGGLYLNKEYSHKKMIKKVFFRLFLPLFVFSTIIYFKRNPTLEFTNIITFVKDFFGNKILGNYWFIYVLMGLYLATPFLQKMCKNLNKNDYRVFIIYTMIFIAIMSLLRHYKILIIASEFSIPLISIYTSYYIIGNYLINFDINLSKKKEILFLIFTIVILIIGMLMTYFDATVLGIKENYYLGFTTITVIVPSISVVYFTKKFWNKKIFSEKVSKIILLFSETTFGVYLIHAFFLGHTKFIYNFLTYYLNINQFISIIIYQILLTIMLSFLVHILKRIPIVKKLI